MKKRIKEVAKSKGYTLDDLAKKMGIIYNALYQRLNVSPKLSTLEEIATILNCEVAELLPLNPPFFHSYDENGNWKGIGKEYDNMKKTIKPLK